MNWQALFKIMLSHSFGMWRKQVRNHSTRLFCRHPYLGCSHCQWARALGGQISPANMGDVYRFQAEWEFPEDFTIQNWLQEGRLGDSKGNPSHFPMIDCHPLKWVDYGGPQVPTATRSCKVDEISPKSPKKMAQVASRRGLTPINIHSANKNTNIRNITLVPGWEQQPAASQTKAGCAAQALDFAFNPGPHAPKSVKDLTTLAVLICHGITNQYDHVQPIVHWLASIPNKHSKSSLITQWYFKMLKNWQQQSSLAFVSCAAKGAARSVKFGVVFFSPKSEFAHDKFPPIPKSILWFTVHV